MSGPLSPGIGDSALLVLGRNSVLASLFAEVGVDRAISPKVGPPDALFLGPEEPIPDGCLDLVAVGVCVGRNRPPNSGCL